MRFDPPRLERFGGKVLQIECYDDLTFAANRSGKDVSILQFVSDTSPHRLEAFEESLWEVGRDLLASVGHNIRRPGKLVPQSSVRFVQNPRAPMRQIQPGRLR